jgi:hypothetical protein
MFDPEAIEAFRRHVETRTVVVASTYTLVGLLIGFVLAAALFGRDGDLSWLAVGSLVGAGLGYILGADRAFMLRLQAQMTLFQAHIEANTQKIDSFESAPTRVNAPPRSLLAKAGLRPS